MALLKFCKMWVFFTPTITYCPARLIKNGATQLNPQLMFMFIPDPTFFHPGSELSPSRIPDPHLRIYVFQPPKNLKNGF
jgi:hypothetical protein